LSNERDLRRNRLSDNSLLRVDTFLQYLLYFFTGFGETLYRSFSHNDLESQANFTKTGGVEAIL